MQISTVAVNGVSGPQVIDVNISGITVNSYEEVDLLTLRIEGALAEISCMQLKKMKGKGEGL